MKINGVNSCLFNLSFKRSPEEHKSWGAHVDPKTKDVSFKLFSYPDAENVDVIVMNKHSIFGKQKKYPMLHMGDGVFETASPISSNKAREGDEYLFSITRNGTTYEVKDPYSYKQKNLLGASTIYDHSSYTWNDDNWYKNNKNRISRLANDDNGLLPVKAARIYEMHIGTTSSEGTFEGAKKSLEKIKQSGFNTIELMPVEGTYAFNWGYDGVDKFAPSEHLGGPDGLKSFIDYAHNLGLNVVMDMVPNHMGPDGNLLRQTGPYISTDGDTPFGDRFNFYQENCRYTRDYIVNTALNWLINYHCDGLRLDMTSEMKSDFELKQIAAEVRYHKPDAFLIVEDDREGEKDRIIAPLKESEYGRNLDEHLRAIDNISNERVSLKNLGYDSMWDFALYHNIRGCMNKWVDLDEIEHLSYCGQDKVKYLMSHDEIGNHQGTRLISKLLWESMNLSSRISLDDSDYERVNFISHHGKSYSEACDCVRAQKTQIAAEKLLKLYSQNNGKYISPERIEEETGFKNIDFETLKTHYKMAVDKSKMAIARIFSIPGIKMVFQGDEEATQTPFRFFREFESEYPERRLYLEKGYMTDISAYKASNLENNSGFAIEEYKTLIKDLNKLNDEYDCLTNWYFLKQDTVKDYDNSIIAMHASNLKDSSDEIVVVTNFSPKAQDYYQIKFPGGYWREKINTDDRIYGGSGKYMNGETIVNETWMGNGNVRINIPPFSTVIFVKERY